jgi:hypothetical protein
MSKNVWLLDTQSDEQDIGFRRQHYFNKNVHSKSIIPVRQSKQTIRFFKNKNFLKTVER